MDKFDISKNYLVISTLWSLKNSSHGIIIPTCPMHAFSSLEDIVLLCVRCCHCIHFVFTHQLWVFICIPFHHFCYWNIWFSFVLFFFIFIVEISCVHKLFLAIDFNLLQIIFMLKCRSFLPLEHLISITLFFFIFIIESSCVHEVISCNWF